ncbi:MAG: lactonase family protein [Acidobacteriia bacterium]|nr:lactonase family protein [Terriglobia bacterium]
MKCSFVRFAVLACGLLMLVSGLSGCGSSSHPAPVQTAAKAEYVYAANLNQVTGFTVNQTTGALSALSNVLGPNGAGDMVADPSANFLYVSDFAGAIDAYAINAATGGLTPISGSPFQVGSGTGPYGLAIDSVGKFLFLTHVNTQSIYVFTRDANTGALTSVPSSPFAANDPWQLVVHPSDNFLYASNTYDLMGSISAYAIDRSTGALTEIAGSPFTTVAGWPGPSGLAISSSGKFLYAGLGGTANANHLVAAFSIDSSTGALTPVSGSPFTTGDGPFRVVLDQSGKYLYTANSHGNTISAFAIDSSTGALTAMSGSPFTTGNFPFALAMDPVGKFLYTANQDSGDISGFSVNATTGALTPLPSSPFSGLIGPTNMVIVKIP